MPTGETTGTTVQVDVIVRLSGGEAVEAGTFPDEVEARHFAEGLITSLTGPEWPRIGDRYVRPEAVVSIDLVREAHPRWVGSTERAAPWAGDSTN